MHCGSDTQDLTDIGQAEEAMQAIAAGDIAETLGPGMAQRTRSVTASRSTSFPYTSWLPMDPSCQEDRSAPSEWLPRMAPTAWLLAGRRITDAAKPHLSLGFA